MPTPFPFVSTKVVPLKYDITIVGREPEDVEREKSLKDVSVDVTNIARTSRLTRSG